MKLSEKIQEALREQQEINLSDPAVQQRLAAQWGYVPAGAQPAPVVKDERAAFREWFEGEQGVAYDGLWSFAKAAWLARAALGAPSVPDGWKEAAIAWEVCASIHREYGKGKDPFFNTRQGDFVKHANDARAMLAAAPEAKP